MRRVLWVILICLAFGTQIAGAEKTKLTLGWCCGQEARRVILEETAKAYMTAHPDVEIELTNPAGYTGLMVTWAAAGNLPDVFWYGVNWPALIDFVMPMDSFLAKTGLNKAIHPSLLHLLQWDDGRTYGVPYGAGVHTMYYNKDIFNKNGFAYPTDKWTWDQAVSMTRKMTIDTDNNGTPDQWGINMDAEFRIHSMLYGGDFYTPDKHKTRMNNPISAKAIQLYMDLKYVDKVWGSKFSTGNVAMATDAAFSLDAARKYSFDWDLVLPPQLVIDGKNYRSNFMGPESWFISKDTKQPDIAQDFVRMLLSEEVMAKYGKSGTVIPSQQRLALKYFVGNAVRGENLAAFIQGLDYGYVNHQTHPIGMEIQGWMYGQSSWTGMWAGTTPPTTALAELEKGVNTLLSEYYQRRSGK